ncbi:hypothetical protein PHYBLDRAFT_59130 [Phycomyces blakesleeanus NRRL 1555(-)]|uniref:Uncharacterized protein n=1 Tax=Phycomyces blakesleeanus (strain ATCC 8743b / DSM 1359 / FGSC 10004 / NBRC 33097 / NRRL 1555) TaxID=763407 RepID=A0A167QQS1_PHYB8|nr:hypothetical protein PHYBLDRAFT_59130 [Phycomyces blakesleeanus NRRL 1555(-)]OAD80088.1 hypothetical protein PHYBLDRAFT_59130 [Phycomyces blakesleeanus NRRL 1555(-)]|eukprot:XP_018298128.1 hypothetical protein PHYBLDRAFT_59130 [Phycomyces blakesleeanus NRRL 1555(-)]
MRVVAVAVAVVVVKFSTLICQICVKSSMMLPVLIPVAELLFITSYVLIKVCSSADNSQLMNVILITVSLARRTKSSFMIGSRNDQKSADALGIRNNCNLDHIAVLVLDHYGKVEVGKVDNDYQIWTLWGANTWTDNKMTMTFSPEKRCFFDYNYKLSTQRKLYHYAYRNQIVTSILASLADLVTDFITMKTFYLLIDIIQHASLATDIICVFFNTEKVEKKLDIKMKKASYTQNHI